MRHRRSNQHHVDRETITQLLEQLRENLKTKVKVTGSRKVELAAWAAVGIVTLYQQKEYRKARKLLVDVCTQPMAELMTRCIHAYQAREEQPKKAVPPTVQVVHDISDRKET